MTNRRGRLRLLCSGSPLERRDHPGRRSIFGDLCADKRRFAAVCGACCLSCTPATSGTCRGCAYELGRTPRGECAVFQCALVAHGIEHCGLCDEFPCALFRAAMPAGSLEERVAALLRRRAIGTAVWIEERMRQCKG